EHPAGHVAAQHLATQPDLDRLAVELRPARWEVRRPLRTHVRAVERFLPRLAAGERALCEMRRYGLAQHLVEAVAPEPEVEYGPLPLLGRPARAAHEPRKARAEPVHTVEVIDERIQPSLLHHAAGSRAAERLVDNDRLGVVLGEDDPPPVRPGRCLVDVGFEA